MANRKSKICSVCLSHAGIVSKLLNIGSRKQCHVIAQGLFWCQESLVEDPPFPLKFVLKVTHPPFKHHNFDQYPLIAPQPWKLAKEFQSALIGSRPRSFQRATEQRCTLPLSPPKGGTKRDFAGFASKMIQLLSKKSATKFLCVKTSSNIVVATSFLYLTVHNVLRATSTST